MGGTCAPRDPAPYRRNISRVRPRCVFPQVTVELVAATGDEEERGSCGDGSSPRSTDSESQATDGRGAADDTAVSSFVTRATPASTCYASGSVRFRGRGEGLGVLVEDGRGATDRGEAFGERGRVGSSIGSSFQDDGASRGELLEFEEEGEEEEEVRDKGIPVVQGKGRALVVVKASLRWGLAPPIARLCWRLVRRWVVAGAGRRQDRRSPTL